MAASTEECGPGNFCGADDTCHPFSCQNWYELANATYTAYKPSLPLTCNEMVSFNMEFPEVDNAAVVFGCMGYVGSLPPPPYQAFNRRCSRDDADLDSKFVCYEMANGTNFQPFVEEAERILIDPCDPEGMPSIPSFIYQVTISREDQASGGGFFASLDGGNATIDFNETLAMGTMFAMLTTAKESTDSPNAPPTATPSNNDANKSFEIKQLHVVLGLIGWFYFWNRK